MKNRKEIDEHQKLMQGEVMRFYIVEKVIPKDDFILSVTFADGVTKEYDVKPLIAKWKEFEELRTKEGLFEQVKVDAGGYGISWNDRIDLSCNELRLNGRSTK